MVLDAWLRIIPSASASVRAFVLCVCARAHDVSVCARASVVALMELCPVTVGDADRLFTGTGRVHVTWYLLDSVFACLARVWEMRQWDARRPLTATAVHPICPRAPELGGSRSPPYKREQCWVHTWGRMRNDRSCRGGAAVFPRERGAQRAVCTCGADGQQVMLMLLQQRASPPFAHASLVYSARNPATKYAPCCVAGRGGWMRVQ